MFIYVMEILNCKICFVFADLCHTGRYHINPRSILPFSQRLISFKILWFFWTIKGRKAARWWKRLEPYPITWYFFLVLQCFICALRVLFSLVNQCKSNFRSNFLEQVDLFWCLNVMVLYIVMLTAKPELVNNVDHDVSGRNHQYLRPRLFTWLDISILLTLRSHSSFFVCHCCINHNRLLLGI